MREYPQDFGPGANRIIRFQRLTQDRCTPNTRSVPRLRKTSALSVRLATYRYYNMDQIVGMALAEFERLQEQIKAGELLKTK